MQLQPLICVSDGEATSRWYQRLFGWQSDHGGREYERLVSNGSLILQLHRWDVMHQHGPLGDPNIKPYGNGVLLSFELEDFGAVASRAEEMNTDIIKTRHLCENAHWECWLRDPEGYTIVLASPLNSAG